ncbi:MAG TPA: PKD domain-containing protein [Chitinophagaceae bacterium]|nr:PKD domain-containing protein [Chitinophagaceae bacterium]
MKYLMIGIAFSFLLIEGCQKSNTAVNTVPVPKPVAKFSILNLVDSSLILEGNILNFDNQSANAVSYHWNFSDGTSSIDKLPSNISFAPCGRVYTITLTVKNSVGDSSSTSQTFNILCSGKHPYTGG